MRLLSGILRVCRPPRRAAMAVAAAGILAAGLGNASASGVEADPRGLELFADLREVLAHRCAGCHGAGSNEGGLDLSTRETLERGGGRGAAIVPGRATESLLYRLAARLEEPHMPEEGDPLEADDLRRLSEWIDRGAPYDRPLLSEADRGPWTSRTIAPEARERWPFSPLADVEIPAPADPEGWCRNPIDRFVLSRLHDAGITPAVEADRRVLRRRIAFDLTGLPPSAEEVAAFASDSPPTTYEEVVDDLLARPSYGERQAQHWLDVARYAESFGYEQDYDRPHAFHYRDFVVGAFNDDLPYDTFLRWQLAGDELAPGIPSARMATGFLAAGAFPTQLTEREFESARSGEIDDMVSTVGTAMLGLTVGCARCHDHKFDPLPQADYYRLAATFTATIRSNAEIEIAPERHAQALAAWRERLDDAIAARKRIEDVDLPARFEAWKSAWSGEPAQTPAPWRVGRIVSATSRGQATLVPVEDGSLLAGGGAADNDTYTIVLDFPMESIAGLRLDALPDASLPRGGPGRVEHGNFALSNIAVTASPIPTDAAEGEPPRAVPIDRARADYSQPGLDVTAAFDADPTSAWAVDPHVGTAHVAVFDFAEPVRHPGGTRLTVQLDFRTNVRHAIGRPRLTAAIASGLAALPVTADGDPVDRHRADSARVTELLAKTDRSAGDNAELHHLHARFDQAWLAADAHVSVLDRDRPRPETTTALVAGDGLKPIPHHADDRGYPHAYPETHFLKRGDVRQRDGIATAGFLQVLSRAPEGDARWQEGAEGSAGRRAALARWITDTEAGAGALAARVMVNRLWQHHFGNGLVDTPSDFGAQSTGPSHPELLEWLAGELVRGSWRIKPIERLIVTSATYRQACSGDAKGMESDPRNRLLSRYPRRRLDAESIRDTLLSISGVLDPALGGRAGGDDTSPRRSIYLDVKRSRLSPFLRTFDAPDRVTGLAQRPITTTAPQALLLMNSQAVRSWAERFAERVAAAPFRFGAEPLDEQTTPIVTAYARALGRPPTGGELADALEFLDTQSAKYVADGREDGRATALADLCQVLLGLNETLHIE